MNPASHLLVGWTLANTLALERRDRAIVTIAGVLPDVDGLGLAVDIARGGVDGDPRLYWTFHHTLAHNLTAALLYGVVAFALAKRRLATATLAFVAIHLHILGDVAGSRGPDGYQWPIPYLQPFSDAWLLSWSGQWELNAWQNFAISSGLLAATGYIAWRLGRTPIELLSPRLDRACVAAMRRRLGTRVSSPGGAGAP